MQVERMTGHAPVDDRTGGVSAAAPVEVRNLTMAYGEYVVQENLSFTVNRGDIFVIMGGSGCGKSTLLSHMVGLLTPVGGEILYDGVDFPSAPEDVQERIKRRFGVLFQGGALWSSLTVAENVGLPLREYTNLTAREIREVVSLKLALVGLGGVEDSYPAELSGGMRKRAGLARAMALDPDILYFDEPSAGLDPVSSRLLDDLIIELRDSLASTVVVVTHELSSIFAIGTNSVLLDGESKTIIASGHPAALRDGSPDPRVRRFLTGGKS